MRRGRAARRRNQSRGRACAPASARMVRLPLLAQVGRPALLLQVVSIASEWLVWSCHVLGLPLAVLSGS